VLSEESIADFADEHVTEIAEWKRNHPQQECQNPPGATHGPENATDGGAADPRMGAREQHAGGELLSAIWREQFAGGLTLQGRKSQLVPAIAPNDPVDKMIAEPADTIKKHNAFPTDVCGGSGCRLLCW